MAEGLKPYDPNKGFISFRLNPDALKEALIEQVPYNRTLRHIYNNPEGDIRETAKIAASETPVLGSILAGEPVDAAKEAFLLGAPVQRSRNALNKHKNTRDWYNYDQRLYYKNNKGQLIDVEPGFSKGDITEARKYNDYQEALADLDKTDKARNIVDDFNHRDALYSHMQQSYDDAKAYLNSKKVKPTDEVYGTGNSVIVYDPNKKLGMEYGWYDVNGNRKWTQGAIVPQGYLQSKLNHNLAFKYDSKAQGSLDKAKKDLKTDIRNFNNDQQWYDNEFEFVNLNNPGEWLYSH